MADHVRTQIRNAAKAALTGLATSGARVFAGRVYKLQDAELPGLRIFTENQTVDQVGIVANPTEENLLELVVECCAFTNTALDDTLDAMAKEVQAALGANQTLGGAKRVSLKTVEINLDGETEKPHGVAKLVFEVLYYSAQQSPDIAI